MNALFWFRHDLRLHDNAALLEVIAGSPRLLCVYIVDSAWFHPRYNHQASNTNF